MTPIPNIEERKKEWDDIEELVIGYQSQFKEDCSAKQKQYANNCGNQLVMKFSPFFEKYINLFKYSFIDWNNKEIKEFIALFIDDYELKKALFRKKINAQNQKEIFYRMNFIIQIYGSIEQEELVADLKMCLLILAKRYKNVGKNFCVYVYNTFRHEMARHIKRHIKNPLNIWYKNWYYQEVTPNVEFFSPAFEYKDNYYEDMVGLPDISWVNGLTCSDTFKDLSVFQRKILIKYYLEDWNDRQIAEHLGAHVNTINQKRREAIKTICNEVGIPKSELKRNRKSGKRVSLPT